jgi:hypothetical protein
LDEDALYLASARDTFRSQRRWQELLSESDRRAMLAQIARVALAIGRDIDSEGRDFADRDVPLAPSEGGKACPIERLAFLEAIYPKIAAALMAMSQSPPTGWQMVERRVPIDRVRVMRLTPALLRAVVQNTQHQTGNARVSDFVRVPSFDTPSNRVLKTFLVKLRRDCGTTATLAENSGEMATARRALHLQTRLRGWLRTPVWQDLPLDGVLSAVNPQHLSASQQVIFGFKRQYESGFCLDWHAPVFLLPSRLTWQLYEMWAFFAVCEALREMGFVCQNNGKEESPVKVTPSGVRIVLETGVASRLTMKDSDGARVSLYYQRSFGREAKGFSGWHSRSLACIPDLVLESDGRLLIFDAKFKTYKESGAELFDIRQLHAYRDGIYHGNRQAVVAAYLLYAGDVGGQSQPILAYPASTPEAPFGNEEVGGICFRPSITSSKISSKTGVSPLQNRIRAFLRGNF